MTAARPAASSTPRSSSGRRSGTALIGAVLITGLIGAFTDNVADNPELSAEVSQEVGIRLEGQVSFVSADQVEAAAVEAGLEDSEVEALVDDYSEAQLRALKTALLFAGFHHAGVVRRHPQPAARAPGGVAESPQPAPA